jgi:folylpolyglutamate synthase/dihydropteroate synthase
MRRLLFLLLALAGLRAAARELDVPVDRRPLVEGMDALDAWGAVRLPRVSAFDAAYAALLARGPGRMVPDLTRITQLAALLGDPQLSYPSVHVTGTNGKGSDVRMVGALCSAAGLSAGTYTSPHLQTVRERLSVAGRNISPTRFAEVHDEVAALADLVDARADDRDGPDADHVTYFELLTAMASAGFADAPVDVGVFEVGMGGVWDATNLVRGDVAVINEVDVDHSELGGSPAEVAGEKVGIVKPGSHVVSAPQPPDATKRASAAQDETFGEPSHGGDEARSNRNHGGTRQRHDTRGGPGRTAAAHRQDRAGSAHAKQARVRPRLQRSTRV